MSEAAEDQESRPGCSICWTSLTLIQSRAKDCLFLFEDLTIPILVCDLCLKCWQYFSINLDNLWQELQISGEYKLSTTLSTQSINSNTIKILQLPPALFTLSWLVDLALYSVIVHTNLLSQFSLVIFIGKNVPVVKKMSTETIHYLRDWKK